MTASEGTAARCEVCGRETWGSDQTWWWSRERIEASCDRLNGDHNAGAADCYQHGYERLRLALRDTVEPLLRTTLGTMQEPMRQMVRACLKDRPHDHGLLSALRWWMNEAQTVHEKVLDVIKN